MTTPERLRELAAATDPRAGITDLFFVSPGDGVTDLLLIRHAQVAGTTQLEDLPLTDIGREQAEVLAQYLSYGKLDALYASPAVRARETAEPIARIHTVDIQTVDDLRDVEPQRPFDRPLPELLVEEFGEEGAAKVLERMRTEMTFDALAPFMEPSAAFRGRVVRAFDEILERHPGGRVIAVTHGPVIMAYVAELLRSTADFPMNPKLTSITRVLAKDGRRTVDFVNATPHFP